MTILDDVDAVRRLLAAGAGPHDGTRRFRPVVRNGALRALVPADSPRAARLALSRSNAPESHARRASRLGYAHLAAAQVRAGADGVVDLPVGGLAGLLEELAGAPVHLTVFLGPTRANRKPVVQALDDRGRLRLVAKLGADELTARLVEAEADALAALAALADRALAPALQVPRLLAFTRWGAAPLVVQSAVRVRRHHPGATPPARAAALRALAAVPAPPGAHATLTGYAAGLRRRLVALPARGAALASAVDPLLDRLGAGLAMTASHGDWSPQNVTATRDGVAAWDWERFAWTRPPGFDILHFRLAELTQRAGHPTPVAGRLLDEAPALLAAAGSPVAPLVARGLVALLLLDLAARYVGDGQLATGSPGARVIDWWAEVADGVGLPTAVPAPPVSRAGVEP